MRYSRSFINFALIISGLTLVAAFGSCKGRTVDNMQPTGDTIEVVINRPDTVNIITTQNLSE